MKNLLFLLVAVLLTSCAPTIRVLLDGAPIPNSSYVSHSPATQMRLEAVVADWRKLRKGEEDNFPRYLKIGESYYLPANISYIGGRIRIVNPLKKRYTLNIIYTVKYGDDKFPFIISHVVYGGIGVDRVFKIGRQVGKKRTEISVRVVVSTKENQKTFDFIFIKYKTRKEVVPME